MEGDFLAGSFLNSIKDVFFPARCLGCDASIYCHQLPLLCDRCRELLTPILSPLCTCCGMPLPAGRDHLCSTCLTGSFSFDLARSLFLYQEPIKSLLLQCKFAGKLTGLATIGSLTSQSAVVGQLSEPEVVVPVPLHITRLRSRGFNQSQLLAAACFPHWRSRINVDLLQRHLHTVPQTSLSGRARRSNLKKAFSVTCPQFVKGRSFLLVDDVFTTGSTLHECAAVLRSKGAARVEAFTLARVQ